VLQQRARLVKGQAHLHLNRQAQPAAAAAARAYACINELRAVCSQLTPA
jgi:hypothetical protein